MKLQLTPHWSGTATVTDAIDGTADTTSNPVMTSKVSKGWNAGTKSDWVAIQTVGTDIEATLASQAVPSSNVVATPTPVDQGTDRSVG